jgi:hypothetical protein
VIHTPNPLLFPGREFAKQQYYRLRLWTGTFRCLPDFIIVGAQKAGTTSLYRYLVSHPEIFGPRKKEINYFDSNYHLGQTWYRSHFPLVATRKLARRCGFQVIAGEASPEYASHPSVPERVSSVVPAARLIFLLRNPVDRAFSHYHHAIRHGWEQLSFKEAIAREGERLAGEHERMRNDENYWSEAERRYSYLSRGLYYEQLLSWLRFFPRDQLLVLLSENLFSSPRNTFLQVVDAIGARPWSPRTFPALNEGSYAETIEDSTRQEVQDYFAPHNDRLARTFGLDLAAWGV